MELASIAPAVLREAGKYVVGLTISRVRDLLHRDYGKFWQEFSSRLQDDRDVPWVAIEEARYAPEFVGRAIALVEGEQAARDAMATYFSEAIREAGLDESVATKRIVDAAEKAAALAPRDDRLAGLARQRQIVGAIESAVGKDGLRTEASPGTGRAEHSPSAAEAAAHLGELTRQQILKLAEERDPEAHEQVVRVLESEGVVGLLRLARSGQSVAYHGLVLVAQLLSEEGLLHDAEEIQVLALKQATDDAQRARQYVRASGVARVQDERERADAHLEEARKLAPEHPAVVVQMMDDVDDPAERLKLLESLDPESDIDQALIDAAKAQAHLIAEDPEAALRHANQALGNDPSSLFARELLALVPLFRAQRAIFEGREPDRSGLAQAGFDFHTLAIVLEQRQRFREAGQMLAQAVEAYSLADQAEQGSAILEDISFKESLGSDERAALAQAAIVSQRPDLVHELLGEVNPDGPEIERLLWADGAILEDADSPEIERAVGYLVELLDSERDDIRARAAFGLLSGAAQNEQIAWNEKAERIVEASKPAAVAYTRAEVLRREGHSEEAEALLLAQGTSSFAMRLLRDFAVEREDWPQARDRARNIFKRSGRPIDQLAYADLSARAGDEATALAEYLALARSEEVEGRLRMTCFSAAAAQLAEAEDWTEVLRVTREWDAKLQGPPIAVWNQAMALARLARHDDARVLLESRALDPETPEQAGLLAEVLRRSAPPEEAVERIAALSDRFDRSVESLEAMVLVTAIAADSDGLSDHLADRVREGWSTFPERFPEQRLFQQIEAPRSREDWDAVFARFGGGDSARQQLEVQKLIHDGKAPVCALSAVSPASIGQVWAGLSSLPLGFGQPGEIDAEKAVALEAIGGAVVWDTASLFIVGGLGEELSDRVRGALSGSAIANDVLQEIDDASAVPLQSGGLEAIPSADGGDVVLIERGEDEVNRVRRVTTGLLALARELEVMPGFIAEDDSRLAEAYRDTKDPAWGAMLGGVGLAKRLGQPLFSDDRFIRAAARSEGIPTFGSIALIEALLERGILDEDGRSEARKRLAEAGAWGLCASGEELVSIATACEFDLNLALRGFFADRATWRGGPADYLREVLLLLAAIPAGDDVRFRKWFHRTIAAFRAAFPEASAADATGFLLQLAIDLGDETAAFTHEFFRRCVTEAHALPPFLVTPGRDPVETAVGHVFSVVAEEPKEVQAAVAKRVINRLPPTLGFEVFQAIRAD